jgi:tRNA-2-methylthio-N6-dimethylallyladenosine synthase
MNEAAKKVFIKSYGCQMNVYDAERMADMLEGEAYKEVSSAEEADLIILNTCHIREKAAEKVYSEIGRLKQLKAKRQKEGKQTLLTVAGCVAQAEGAEILRRAPAVDIVVGPQSYHHLPDMLKSAASARKKPVDTDFPTIDKFAALPEPHEQKIQDRGPTAFLTIQEGCDKFCTFCVVPYTRGAEYSRPLKEVLKEADRLLENGVKEVTVLGQNVNAYHGEDEKGDTVSLADLLRTLAAKGTPRLRYTTSHPRDMDEDLINLHGELPVMMPYLHLPVQSGSDRILEAMNRQHKASHYYQIIEKVRKACPHIALSSDFIVGFPGETDQDFKDTMKLIENIDFAQSFSFKYSPRPGTPASSSTDQVPEELKSERLAQLQDLLEKQRLKFNQATVGQTVSVLVERRGKETGIMSGRSPYLQTVQIETSLSRIGDIIDVRIKRASANTLYGEDVTNTR